MKGKGNPNPRRFTPEDIENAKLRLEEARAVRKGMTLEEWREHRERSPKRAKYMRHAVLKLLNMTPEARAAFQPRNGFDEMAKHLVDAPNKPKGEGDTAIKAWKEVKETLGERIGSNWKDTVEHKKGYGNIIVDIPQPDDEPIQ